MSASSVIGDVMETLRFLLETRQDPPNQFTVSDAMLADQDVPQAGALPAINLFLFRVAENPFAKNQDWAPLGSDRLQYPPLALNLFYMLTPFGADRLIEHRALGEAMRIFYDNSIIKAPLLRGASLEHSGEELKLDLCQINIEELTRIWNALNRPYRLSVCYEVRIVLVDSRTIEPARRVVERENQFV